MTDEICRPPRSPDLALPELPAAGPLRLEVGGDYDTEEYTGVDPAGQDGRGARFLDCAVRAADLGEARLTDVRILSSVLEQVRGVGTQLAGARLRDVEVREARLGGVQLHGGKLERVRFVGGKFDYVNFRQSTFKDVAFEGCVLVEPDLAGADLTRVSFHDCELRGVSLAQATLRDVDFRRAAVLELAEGFDRLAGGVVTPAQLMELAPGLAARMGLRVAS